LAFLLREYLCLLESLKAAGYSLGPVNDYFGEYVPPFVFLRHDVDRFPTRALVMAREERELGIRSTYYFRCDKNTRYSEYHIREIADMGHEVGFHYESFSRHKGDIQRSLTAFKEELIALRQFQEVATVAPHGDPLSKYSNMERADILNLKELGILGDAQFDINFSNVLYITDTGGIFGSSNNRRDWVEGQNLRTPTPPDELAAALCPSTTGLVLLSTHPERWPSSLPGLIQAKSFDYIANLLKCLAKLILANDSPDE
jgi:hypothetical protein